MPNNQKVISKDTLRQAFELMSIAKAMTEIYEANFKFVSKYVHATSRGHEAVQIALGILLEGKDYLSAYYRDDALLLAIGMQPYELMLQLMAKRDDPFSGGRSYYSHPSLKRPGLPKIPHQSSATGMQAIPTTGIAMGVQYRELQGLAAAEEKGSIVVCSLGDASITEGEVAEAFHMTSLKQLPLLYLVQDNEWDISAHSSEIRKGNAVDYIKGFPGVEGISIDGTDFASCYATLSEVIRIIRTERRPFLVHAKVPLLNHHTSGVRKEWYRDDLEAQSQRDPFPRLRSLCIENGISEAELDQLVKQCELKVEGDFNRAKEAEDPRPEDLYTHDFAPTPIREECGVRHPLGGEEKVMVDCALFAVEELLRCNPECLLYGQDVGKRLGGVFREAATLAQKFGDHRVFNTPIQEAFIVGSTVGMSAAGLRPIVEVQFADYIWPGLNQLFTEVARSCYLTNGKYPVSMILRVPIGAYGSGGPYHSSSVESVVCNIKGVKVAYPSNGADLKGLMKAAYHDPNPVVIFEHKGLYWSKVPGTDAARCVMPDEDYVVPLGMARLVQSADPDRILKGEALALITYGMGVHWALNASRQFEGQLSILDLRSLVPLDTEAIYNLVRSHHRCLVVTEETIENSFAQTLAGRIGEHCFEYLDAPVRTIGSVNMPAIPLNSTLEKEMVLNADKVAVEIKRLLNY
ncbi:MAG: tungsten formylmethanofuran dehydrogenase [Saprospiraceae bacterium]|nr:tungsten formylmethanofuran dehydrogenase [Saprospiraceae bacterium]HMW39577.1 thiamine pyrophosphate-dependent enzyme [Saprospiraceae bacterium]HMX86869.1 thiamine pyrophosphate-dependent enzyme [Saprospiraceae bacterium]HMZ39023.1 thiamine pyrophosphate-dependent enzyme [Saprospiraceae bacterium]HNA65067.1 thiamine pyrophosphate-dependent enzyme [Saprospiraceae bacterium]